MSENKKMNSEELEKVAGGQLALTKEETEKIIVNKDALRDHGSYSVRKCNKCGKEFTVHHPDAGKLTWQQENFCNNCAHNWWRPLESKNESN